MQKLLFACVVALLVATPANAACFKNIGCTDEDRFDSEDLEDLKCSQLWVLRNSIYHEAGLCFQTKRAIGYFGNDECEYDDAGDIEFSQVESYNIGVIIDAEDDRGC